MCLGIAPNGFDEIIYVPDRGFNEWIPSHPLGFIKLLQELNDAHGGKVRPLGKLLKHFRNYQMKSRKPKSYWLGALLLHHVQKDNGLDMSKALSELFHDLLDAIYRQYDHLLYVSETATPNIPDPLLDHNISWNWSRTHFETFMRRLDDGRCWAAKALESEDRETAIGWWQKIFGEEYFPSEIEQAAANLARAGLPGQSIVTVSGLVTPKPPVAGVYTPTRQTTFHGET